MKPVTVLHFPKKCHLHSAPMSYEEHGDLSSGWKCPKCTLTCPKHGSAMRSGAGMLYPVGVLYCRRCRIAQIKKEAQRIHTPPRGLGPLAKEGVAHVWRIPV